MPFHIMKYLHLITVIVVSTICSITSGFGQEIDRQIQRSLSATFFREQITLPFKKTDALQKHWGGTISYEISKKRIGAYQFAHIFQGGFYNHNTINQVAFVAWKPKFELRFRDTFNVHAILGLGYAHSFPTQPSYQLNNSNYERKTNWGTPHLMPSIGLGTGFHFDKIVHLPIEVFIRYEAFSLAPYKPKGTLPFSVNTMLALGARYTFN